MKKLLLFGLVAAPCIAAAAGGAEVPPSYEETMAQSADEPRIVSLSSSRFSGKNIIIETKQGIPSEYLLVYEPSVPNVLYAVAFLKGETFPANPTLHLRKLDGYCIINSETPTESRVTPVSPVSMAVDKSELPSMGVAGGTIMHMALRRSGFAPFTIQGVRGLPRNPIHIFCANFTGAVSLSDLKSLFSHRAERVTFNITSASVDIVLNPAETEVDLATLNFTLTGHS